MWCKIEWLSIRFCIFLEIIQNGLPTCPLKFNRILIFCIECLHDLYFIAIDSEVRDHSSAIAQCVLAADIRRPPVRDRDAGRRASGMTTVTRPSPLQNRVTPTGEIVADPGRGLLMGNRGCLHDPDRRLRTARRPSPSAVACLCLGTDRGRAAYPR